MKRGREKGGKCSIKGRKGKIKRKKEIKEKIKSKRVKEGQNKEDLRQTVHDRSQKT
jgi:hypothetical protein